MFSQSSKIRSEKRVSSSADVSIVMTFQATSRRVALPALNQKVAGHECPAYNSEYLEIIHHRLPRIALHGWWLVATLVFIPPLAAVDGWLWKVIPVLAIVHESALDQSLQYIHQLIINALNFIGNFWWVFLATPLTFFFWFGTARLVALTRADSASGSLGGLQSHS